MAGDILDTLQTIHADSVHLLEKYKKNSKNTHI